MDDNQSDGEYVVNSSEKNKSRNESDSDESSVSVKDVESDGDSEMIGNALDMQFSWKVDTDGIWKSGPPIRTFTLKILNEIIDHTSVSLPLAAFVLPTFTVPCSKFCKFEFKESFDDSLLWWKTDHGKRWRPRPRNIELEGQKFRYYNCNSPLDDQFKKYIVYPLEKTSLYIIYVSLNGFPDYSSMRPKNRKRIDEKRKEAILDALDGRNVKEAHRYLVTNDIEVTKIQVRNQTKYQPTTVLSKRGRQSVTTPEMLAELSHLKGVTTSFTGDEFILTYIDQDLMKVFVNSLPNKEDVDKFREVLVDCESWSQMDLDAFCDTYAHNSNSGIVKSMIGQIQIDSTFDLSDLVVTTLTCDLNGFQSSCSGKIRHVMIGFMLSAKKTSSNHQYFATLINSAFFKYDQKKKKCIPSLITDGEAAFKHYQNMEYVKDTTQILRCMVHRRKNYEMIGRENRINQREKELVFGKEDENGIVRGGIMNSLSVAEMNSKITSLPIPLSRKTWLMDRIDSLFEHHSLKSKLRSGLLLNYVSTNRTECLNSRLKIDITRRTDGKRCALQLIKFIDQEKREMCKAILEGNSDSVVYEHFRSTSHATPENKAKILMTVGFCSFPVAFVFNVPIELWKEVQDFSLKNVFQKDVVFTSDDNALVEKDTTGYVKVIKKDGVFKCQERKCTGDLICTHILAVISKLTSSQCYSLFKSMVQKRQQQTRKDLTKSLNNGKASKRYPGRQYSTFSHGNQSRTVNRFHSSNDATDSCTSSILPDDSAVVLPIEEITEKEQDGTMSSQRTLSSLNISPRHGMVDSDVDSDGDMTSATKKSKNNLYTDESHTPTLDSTNESIASRRERRRINRPARFAGSSDDSD